MGQVEDKQHFGVPYKDKSIMQSSDSRTQQSNSVMINVSLLTYSQMFIICKL